MQISNCLGEEPQRPFDSIAMVLRNSAFYGGAGPECTAHGTEQTRWVTILLKDAAAGSALRINRRFVVRHAKHLCGCASSRLGLFRIRYLFPTFRIRAIYALRFPLSLLGIPDRDLNALQTREGLSSWSHPFPHY